MEGNKEDRYNWNSFINNKAIIDFEVENNLRSKRIGMNCYYLLSFFIDLHINTVNKNGIIKKTINDKVYIYASTLFIINNLPLLKTNRQSLTGYLERLERYGYIERFINDNYQRFIGINDELLKHCLKSKRDK